MTFVKEFFLWLFELGESILEYLNRVTNFFKNLFGFNSSSSEDYYYQENSTELAGMPGSNSYPLMLIGVESDAPSIESEVQQANYSSDGLSVTSEILRPLNVLGIFKNIGEKVTRFEIKEAFKAKCLQTHPDRRNQIDASVFIEVKKAFEILEKFLMRQSLNSLSESRHHEYSYEYRYTASYINNVSRQIDELLKMVRELIKMCEQINNDIDEAYQIVASIDTVLKDFPDNQGMIQESKIFLLQTKIDSNRAQLSKAEQPLITARNKKYMLELNRESASRLGLMYEENYQKVVSDLKQLELAKSNTSDELLKSQLERSIQENMRFKEKYAESILDKKQKIEKIEFEVFELDQTIFQLEAEFSEFIKINDRENLVLHQQLNLLTNPDESKESILEENPPVLCSAFSIFEQGKQESSNTGPKLNIDL